jgi:hypothetical protein
VNLIFAQFLEFHRPLPIGRLDTQLCCGVLFDQQMLRRRVLVLTNPIGSIALQAVNAFT